MPRYFLEVAYMGTHYSGSQVQENAGSVQEELEKAFSVYFRKQVQMTGSSRTDAGVHALQNFFHLDWEETIPDKALYHINAILPADIVLKAHYPVQPESHCRFDAISREYHYHIYRKKDPFLKDRAFFYPYTLSFDKLQAAAEEVMKHTDFEAFSKRNAQARTSVCIILRSQWVRRDEGLEYQVEANRFLRGMVRGLVGTMLQVGRGRITAEDFARIIEAKDSSKVDFSVPGHGLFLAKVKYGEGVLGVQDV